MNLLEWNNEKMSSGIEIIDEQHKKLLDIINKLNCSILNFNQKKDISIIVDELVKYIGYHFKTEEKLFIDIYHEEVILHKEEHITFKNKIFQINKNLKNNEVYLYKYSIETLSDLFNYLAEWFIHHVVYSDRSLLAKIK